VPRAEPAGAHGIAGLELPPIVVQLPHLRDASHEAPPLGLHAHEVVQGEVRGDVGKLLRRDEHEAEEDADCPMRTVLFFFKPRRNAESCRASTFKTTAKMVVWFWITRVPKRTSKRRPKRPQNRGRFLH
jgi:hypothetical protein